MARGTVILFARRPDPARCKRRLARALGGRAAAAVYTRLLARALAAVTHSSCRRPVLACAAPDEVDWFRGRLGARGWRVWRQGSGDIGARMHHALARALATGAPAVLIGSDIADVRARDLRRAFEALHAGADLVLGPAADGGYWLIGLARPAPGLFRDMPWSTAAVAHETLARARAAGLVGVVLPVLHDVDRPRDFTHLRRHPRAALS